MSRMEGMIRMVLSAMDIDVAVVQEEVTTRITNFERDFKTLNNAIIGIHYSQQRTEKNLRALMAKAGVPYDETPLTPTATEEPINVNDSGRALPPPP